MIKHKLTSTSWI